jgi:phosphohistidine swiveling domain-containing protein
LQSNLISRLDSTKSYAVRSSAVGEDGRKSSYAGIFDSVLSVEVESVVDAIKKVWQSADSERVRAYRENQEREIEMAVIVQEMVDCDVAGVAYSADPATNDRNVMVVEAVEGLGDKLMTGEVSPSQYRIDRNTEEIEGEDDLLKRDQVQAICQAVATVEEFFGVPMEIEWGYKDKLYITQARPISTIRSDEIRPELSKIEPGIDLTQHIRREGTLFSMTCIMHGNVLSIDGDFDHLAIQEKEDPSFYRVYLSGLAAVVQQKLEDAVRRNDLASIDFDLQMGIDMAEKLRVALEDPGKTIEDIDFPELFELFRKYMWFSASLPFFIGNVFDFEETSVQDNTKLKAIKDKVSYLRSQEGDNGIFVAEVLEPSAQKWLADGGIEIGIADLGRLTVQEVLARDCSMLPRRREGRLYYFQRKEEMVYVGSAYSPEEIFGIDIESLNTAETNVLYGQVVWSAQAPVVGSVIRVEKRHIKNFIDRKLVLEDGKILVTSCISPAHIPLLSRVVAVISDEGGKGAHAFHIGRERNIPMIAGVTGASLKIQDGDIVEIDCTDPRKGKVRIIR